MRLIPIRYYGPGDSMLRLALTEPGEFLIFSWGRVACRVLRRHNRTCRGRVDHRRGVG